MIDIPPYWRFAIAVVVVCVSLSLDLLKPRGDRHRVKEWTFVGGSVLVGILVGVTVDLFTSNLSPEYFEIAKGFSRDFDVADVVAFGAQAGGGAGAVLGLLLALCNREPACVLAFVKRLWVPALLALSAGALFGVGAMLTGFELPLELDELNEETIRRFSVTWCIHLGVYAGAIVGAVRLGKEMRTRNPGTV